MEGLGLAGICRAPFTDSKFVEFLNGKHFLEAHLRDASWRAGLSAVLLAGKALRDPLARPWIGKEPLLSAGLRSHGLRV